MRNTSAHKLFVCMLATVSLAGCGGGGYGGGGPKPIVVTVRPAHASVVAGAQTQQFAATVTGAPVNTVTWSVDSIAGGNATTGTVSASGLYTSPAAAGTHTVAAASTADATKTALASVGITDLAGVLTHHNNVARDGTNIQEFALAPSVVNQNSFGKLFSCPVDGAVYAQPLWVPALNIGGTVHNVFLVATQHDSAYAFDADAKPCAQLWKTSLIPLTETPVPFADVGSGFGDIQPEIGVTGTPVIDLASKTMYLIAKSEGLIGTFHQRLHALDLATGNEKLGGPVVISASVPGTGDGSVGGFVSFNPHKEHERSGLALANGVVYTTWASHEDDNPYHGWIIGYNATTLAKVSVYNSTANGSRGGIWMAGAPPAFDSSGNLYASTGNGTFDADQIVTPNNDFGDSILKLDPSTGLTVSSWFTPFNQSFLDSVDLDLGSGAMVVMPDQTTGPHPHLLVMCGKQGQAYLLNRDSLGQYCPASGGGCSFDTNAVQSFTAFQSFGSFWGTPAFWQNRLYLGGTQEPPNAGDKLKAFDFNPATGQFNPTASSQSSTIYGYPGSTPSVSSQGATGGVVWDVDASQYGPPAPGPGPAVLHAYDATNLATELWNSSQATAGRDVAGNAVKFSVPTVANGKVYLGTGTEVDVYGLLP